MSNYSSDSHVYLYAKGWYKKNDVIDDLKTILGERSGVEPRHIRKSDIIIVLSNIVWKDMNAARFQTFLANIINEPIFPNREKEDIPVEDRIIEALLRSISLMPVKSNGEVVVNICDPDPELLPLAREGIAYGV